MADEKIAADGLDKPVGAGIPNQDEPVIFVMPEEFYGAAAGAKPKEEATTAAVPPVSAPVSVPTSAPNKPAAKSSRKFSAIVALMVILLVGALAVAAYFLFFAAPPAVCGNDACEQGETFAACPNDCEPPPPVCGDGNCESAESYLSCPSDCRQPEPVCGDGQCAGDETAGSCPSDCLPPAVCGDGQCAGEETAGSCPSDCQPSEPVASADSDSDGITDIEETDIFGSDPHGANGDGDSFVDLNEVLNLFDPARKEPSRLIDNPGVSAVKSVDLGVEVYYPTAWRKNELPVDREIRFAATTGETISVAVYEKESGMQLTDWLKVAPVTGLNVSGQVERSINRRGFEQVTMADRRTVVISDGTNVALLRYDLGGQSEIRYRVTLSMMANSLVFVREIAQPQPEPELSEDSQSSGSPAGLPIQ
ncbi:MAG: hypothetical protein ABIJ46_03130 [bacterium]